MPKDHHCDTKGSLSALTPLPASQSSDEALRQSQALGLAMWKAPWRDSTLPLVPNEPDLAQTSAQELYWNWPAEIRAPRGSTVSVLMAR